MRGCTYLMLWWW